MVPPLLGACHYPQLIRLAVNPKEIAITQPRVARNELSMNTVAADVRRQPSRRLNCWSSSTSPTLKELNQKMATLLCEML